MDLGITGRWAVIGKVFRYYSHNRAEQVLSYAERYHFHRYNIQPRFQFITINVPNINSRKSDKKMDNDLYRYRYLVENTFARVKHFRTIATRYDKLEWNYASLALAFVIIWLPMWIE
ncbi:transposase [Xenorhabdus sp. SGI246]|uniref:transposase n=1 Tax=Xenorhabdus sp. SGI246 TaxID=3158263 RepID=UPI00349FB1FF